MKKVRIIPFSITRDVPDAETLAAMREVGEMRRHPERYKSYRTAEDMMEDVLRTEYITSINQSFEQLNSGKGVQHELIEDAEDE